MKQTTFGLELEKVATGSLVPVQLIAERNERGTMQMMQRNNNSKVEYKEGMNLLDAGSSDDDQEHFSIPPALRLNIHEEGRR